VSKGLYSAGRSLEVLEQVIGLQCSAAWEAEYENDASSVPQMLAEVAHRLGNAALAMVAEEIAEALASLKPDANGEVLVETIYAGAHPEFVKEILGNEELMKIGARNARADAERLQKIHDNVVELGASCGTDEEEAEKLVKRAETDPVIKGILTENAELKKQVGEAVTGIGELTESMTKMREEMVALKATPAPMAPRTSVVDKTVDGRTEGATSAVDVEKASVLIAELSKTADGQRMLAEAAIRASQATVAVRP
jgi:hypothetical protein